MQIESRAVLIAIPERGAIVNRKKITPLTISIVLLAIVLAVAFAVFTIISVGISLDNKIVPSTSYEHKDGVCKILCESHSLPIS